MVWPGLLRVYEVRQPEGIKALIERESARRLAALGGSEPELKVARRRRSTTNWKTV